MLYKFCCTFHNFVLFTILYDVVLNKLNLIAPDVVRMHISKDC